MDTFNKFNSGCLWHDALSQKSTAFLFIVFIFRSNIIKICCQFSLVIQAFLLKKYGTGRFLFLKHLGFPYFPITNICLSEPVWFTITRIVSRYMDDFVPKLCVLPLSVNVPVGRALKNSPVSSAL